MKELRLENVCDMEAGNAFLPGFLERFNKQFACKPAATADLHRRVTDPSRLNDVLSQREQRHVSEQLTLSYDRKQLILERNEVSEELGGKYVEVYAFPDGRLEVRSNGHVLPYRVFNKDQRVSPTAIVERKRLSHALSIIKAKQEATPVPKAQTNSEKNGYRKKGRMIYGAPPATETAMEMWKSPKAAIPHIPTARRLSPYNDKIALQIRRRYRFAATQLLAPDRMSYSRPIEMSDCPRKVMAFEADDYGLGADERTRCTTHRGSDGSSGWQADGGFCGDRAGGEREAGWAGC